MEIDRTISNECHCAHIEFCIKPPGTEECGKSYDNESLGEWKSASKMCPRSSDDKEIVNETNECTDAKCKKWKN